MRLLTILFLFFTNSIFAAGYCTDYENVATDVITLTPADPADAGDPGALENCQFAPDGYEITIYEFGMCTTAPTAPTGASAADTSTNCVTVFQNESGEAFNLAAGVSFDTSSSEKPANGTYTHGYVIMENTFGISIAQEFGTVMGGINSGSGTGLFCSSAPSDVDASVQYYASEEIDLISANHDYVSCSASRAPATRITEVLDQFGCTDFSDPATCDFTASGAVPDGSMNAYLVNEAALSGALVDQTAGSDPARFADRLIGFLSWTTPVVITDSTSEADLQFSVNNGTSPSLHPPSNGDEFDLFSFMSGPFSLNIQVQ